MFQYIEIYPMREIVVAPYLPLVADLCRRATVSASMMGTILRIT